MIELYHIFENVCFYMYILIYTGEIEGLLCKIVRVDCLNLIEAWQFSDMRIDSTLGRSDGKVYIYRY